MAALQATGDTSLVTNVQCLRLCQVFKSGNIVDSIGQSSDKAVLVTSDSKTFMLSASDASNAAGMHLNNLVVVEVQPGADGDRVTRLVFLNEEGGNALAIQTK